jgi:FlaA1/EpsC-like NDP-sugar epimerase
VTDITLARAAGLARQWHRPLAVALQMGLVVLSNRLAFLLRFDAEVPHWANEAFWLMLPWLVAIRAVTFVAFKLNEGLWRHSGIYDLRAIAGGVGTSSLVFFLFTHTPVAPAVYPRSIFFVDALILMLLLGGVRMSRRLAAELFRGTPEKRVLIFGAGDAGELIVRAMKHNPSCRYQPVGFVDDDPAKVGHRIHGVPVLGAREDLSRIMALCQPHEVLLALPRAEPAAVRSVVRSLEPFKMSIKTLPNLQDLIDGQAELSQIRSLSVEDLLARAPIGLDPAPVEHLIAGRRVMVTGAGGSIGSELCRQLVKLAPASLVMLERYENSLHAIRLELEDASQQFGVRAVVGDVTDAVRVREVIKQHQPEIVFHAAAHKHVPLMEENPCEAIKNNVRGTRLLAHAAEEHGVDRFILISTDKAVNPTSVMGASKRLAELVIQAQAVGSGTSFAIVRFGNVLASNGSVVPRFVDQIKKGGPVTITHPEMRRFFMLIPEAVQLVLHAAAQAQSGATYVLEMGEQVKLLDMARDLIRLSGFVPDEEIPIEFIGLRPGEKLYEELVGRDEHVEPSAVQKILRVTSRAAPRSDFASSLAQIESAAAAGRHEMVHAALRKMVGLVASERTTPAGGVVATAPAHAAPVVASTGRSLEEIMRSLQETVEAFGAAATEGVAKTSLPGDGVPAACARPSEGPAEQPCPSCQSRSLHRSRARNFAERVRRSYSPKRLFRCADCSWRGWLLPLEFGDPAAVEPVATPDLVALDSAVQGFQVPLRSFSPRDLQ